MTDYNPTDEELMAEAVEYIYGVNDFSDLPLTVARVIPSPDDHPDNDPFRPVRALQPDAEWNADMAELWELVDRIEAGICWLGKAEAAVLLASWPSPIWEEGQAA